MQENNEEKSIEKEQLQDDFERIIREFFGLSLLSKNSFTINSDKFVNQFKQTKKECTCSTCRQRKQNIELLEKCYKMEYVKND